VTTEKRRILTGITTSGTPHLGNYVGAIRPAIAASRDAGNESFYFLADYHALIKCDDAERIQRSTLEIAASWLACGLDPDKVFFYRQSDIPEIPELTWLLTCVTAKGLLNRAHAYKAAVDQNTSSGEDPDAGINAGLYMYPVLMAADILIFGANEVPVGRDQIQHIEMARDIAQRFNHMYGLGLLPDSLLTLPEAKVDENVATLPGTDGRKMSKSYDNTIPLWLPEKQLKKAIYNIVTDSSGPNEPKDPESSSLFAIFQAFANPEESSKMRRWFAEGVSWHFAKEACFQLLNRELEGPRDAYQAFIKNPSRIEDLLQAGASKARERSRPFMAKMRRAVGLRSLNTHPVQTSAGIKWSTNEVIQKTSTSFSPQLKSYREADGKFYFKLISGDGAVLLQSRAFDSPKDAGRLTAALIEAGGASSTVSELLLQSVPPGETPVTSTIVAALAQLKADKLAKERDKKV